MKIGSVFDSAFQAYGQVAEGYDFAELLQVLALQPRPQDAVMYVASCAALEAVAVYADIRDRYFGGMPVEIGYCNGSNTVLNCFEYHRDSELNIFLQDAVLLVGKQQDIVNFQYDTSKVEAFLAPAGSAVEFYATTLHYAPCEAKLGEGFRVAVVLPRGTNTDKPSICAANAEDKLLFARNKWLIAHPDAPEAAQGAHVGLVGKNIDIAEDIR